MDSLVEDVWIGEGLVSEMAGFQIAPNDLDVVEFRGVFGQPLDGEPMGAFGERGMPALLTWIGPLSSTRTTGLKGAPGFGP